MRLALTYTVWGYCTEGGARVNDNRTSYQVAPRVSMHFHEYADVDFLRELTCSGDNHCRNLSRTIPGLNDTRECFLQHHFTMTLPISSAATRYKANV